MFIGKEFSQFRTESNGALQTVIPVRHQSLGATERRRRYFREILTRIKWKIKNNQIKGWRGWADVTLAGPNWCSRERSLGRTPNGALI